MLNLLIRYPFRKLILRRRNYQSNYSLNLGCHQLSNKKTDSLTITNDNINVPNSKNGNECFSPSQKDKSKIPTELQEIINTITLEQIEYLKRPKDKILFDSYIKNKNYKIAVIKGREIILKQRKIFTQ